MAEFLDKLKGTLDKGISTVNVKSKEIIGKQRIRLQLSELEAERKIALQDLGKIIHASYEARGGKTHLPLISSPNSLNRAISCSTNGTALYLTC